MTDLKDLYLVDPLHIRMTSNGHGDFPDGYRLTSAGVELIESLLAQAWDDALTHVWKLNGPASSIIVLPDRPLLTEADIHQARSENPYK